MPESRLQRTRDAYSSESVCIGESVCIYVGQRPPFEHDIERWKRELREAGWTEKTSYIWRSPSGALWAGPHGAWRHMKRLQA